MKSKYILFSLALVLLLFGAYVTFAVASTFTLVSPTFADKANVSDTASTGAIYVNFTSNQSFLSAPRLELFNITGGGGITNVTMNINGTAATANYSYFNVSGLSNGTYQYRISGINTTAAGDNQTFGNFTVTIGQIYASAITNPVNGTNTTDTTPEIRISANSTFLSNMSVTIYTNKGGTIQAIINTSIVNGTETYFNLTALTLGTYNVIAELGNGADFKVNSTAILLNVSSLTVAMTSPVNSTNTSDSTPEIRVSANSSQYSNLSLTLYTNFGGVIVAAINTTILNGTETAFNMSGLNNGTYSIIAEAGNGADLKQNATAVTIVVGQIYNAVITSPVNRVNSTDTTPEIKLGANSTFLGNMSVTFYWNNAWAIINTSILNATETSFNMTGLNEGENNITAEFGNSADFRVNVTRTIFIDAVPSLVVINKTVNTTINIGNLSQLISLRFNVTPIGANATTINVTIDMPFGFRPVNSSGAPDSSFCNAAGGFTAVNATTARCSRTVNTTLPAGIAGEFELNVTANISAYTSYGDKAFVFAVNCTDGSSAVAGGSCAQSLNTTVMRSAPTTKNPRPSARIGAATTATLLFNQWNQTDATYKMMTPIMTFNQTLGRPVLAADAFGDILFFDKTFFEEPTMMRLFSYNLTFKLVFGPLDNATFLVSSPVNSTLPQFENQRLIPLSVQTSEFRDFRTNNSRNFTFAFPSSSSFTVYMNGTAYTEATLLAQKGVNMTWSGGDQSALLLQVTVPDSNVTSMNNTDISVLFTLMNGSSVVSPVYVNSQSISGWSFDSPPQFGSSFNQSYLINMSNRLANYTLNDLRISIMQPMNVTMNKSGTVNQFNMTTMNKIKISLLNGTTSTSAFIENLSLVRTESTFSFIDTGGPTGGANVTLYITTFDVVLSNSTTGQTILGNWDPNTATSPNYTANAVINFTAEMQFPILDAANNTPGVRGTENSYNATVQVSTRAPLNMSGQLPGLNASVCGSGTECSVNVTIDGMELPRANYTIGSLIIEDLTPGSHVISVKYSLPAAASSSSSSSSSGGGGGTIVTTQPKKTQIFSQITPGAAAIMKISDADIGLKQITIEVKNPANTVTITVIKLDGQPAAVTQSVTGKVFQWLNITKQNLDNSNIQSAKIRFNVTKSWLTSNGFSAADVVLRRFTTLWESLPTVQISESSTDVEYEATTPGFSTFVIVGEQAAPSAPAPQPTPETPAPEPQPEQQQQPAPEQPAYQPSGTDYTYIGIFVVLVIIAIGYFVVMRPRKSR